MNGWALIALVVLGYDGWAITKDQPTLSRMYADTATVHPLAVGLSTSYLVSHLWGKWPRKADPFLVFAWAIGRLAQRGIS